MSKQKNRKTLLNEKLPDPKSATADLAAGDPRGRTAAHLKRILAASLSLPLAAGVTSCSIIGYQVVDPIPPPAVLPQAFGTLKVKSPMSVAIDGRAFQAMTAGAIVSIPEGTHTIQVTRPSNTATFAIEISIERNATRTPAAPPAPSGVFKTLSAATIQIDGKPPVVVTAQESIELSAGTHMIEISPTSPSLTHSFSLEIRTGTSNPQNRGQ
jgi:hypothetical protein